MKKNIFIILIMILAAVLRFWQLGQNPPSLDWDEASLGYNAYSIFLTDADEYGTILPLSIRSFGDNKPPIYTYLTVPLIPVLGLSEFTTRLPSAIVGLLTLLIVYLFANELFGHRKKLSFLVLFLTAISPWHLQFSRVAFEANIALFFYLTGILFFLKGVKKGVYFALSFISFTLSVYAYHSPRLVIPLLLIGLTGLFYKKIIKTKSSIFYLAAGFIIFAVAFAPLILQLKTYGTRFGSVSVINPDEKLVQSIQDIEIDNSRNDFLGKLTHNRRIVYFREILAGYLDHLNFEFLFLSGDPPLRHHVDGMGMLYFWEILFIPVGIIILLNNLNLSAVIIFLLYLIAPAASSLASGTPHAVRALLYIPLYQFLTSLGLLTVKNFFKSQNISFANTFYLIITAVITVNIYYYLNIYWRHAPIETAPSWQYGYKQAVYEAKKIEQKVDKIVVTYRYDQPYIYFLFYNKIDPSWYQNNWGGGEIRRFGRAFGKYEFRNIEWEQDRQLTNTLFIGTPAELSASVEGLYKTIYFPDGQVAFRLVLR